MGVNDFGGDIDGQEEGGVAMGNVSEQISEAYKEEIKRGTKQAKQTRKDEKKAKKQDLLLAKFLVKILIDKSYDNILPDLFKAFDAGVPSNFILGIMSLVYIDISNELRTNVGKPLVNFSYHSEEMTNFSGSNLDQNVKDRVNAWVEDINTVIALNPSKLYLQRIETSILESKELYSFSVNVFSFFLSQINIYIPPDKAQEYVRFILKNIVLTKLKSVQE